MALIEGQPIYGPPTADLALIMLVNAYLRDLVNLEKLETLQKSQELIVLSRLLLLVVMMPNLDDLKS